MQDELPPQPEMRLGGVKGFLPYHAVANMMYGAMGPPLSEQEITGLRNRYLDKFLPSRRSKAAAGESASASAAAAGGDADDSAADAGASRPTSLQFGYCPIVDLSVPSQPLCVFLGTGRVTVSFAHLCPVLNCALHSLVQVDRGYEPRQSDCQDRMVEVLLQGGSAGCWSC